jgi:hypothetical protein
MRWFAAAFIGMGLASMASASDLRVGAASGVITPPPGTPMAGYYNERAAEGVHDDLFARAVVMEKDGTKAALVVLDLISTTRSLVEDARHKIEADTGIPAANVMISATHSHTGPVLRGRGAREADFGGEKSLAVEYARELPGKVANVVRQANEKLRPGTASVSHGHESSIAFNRRYHMTDGSVGWNPGKLNPRVIKPAGGIDPDVPIIYFASAEREARPIATNVNYAVHLDNIGGLKISADVPGVVTRLLADFKGPEMVTLWSAGCCGDINHIDVNWAEPQKGFENAARMGTIFTAEVLRAWPHLKPVPQGKLASLSTIVDLDLPPVSDEDVSTAKEVVARRRDPNAKAPAFMELVQAYKVLDVVAREGRPQQVEVQVVTLGKDLAWVSLPGEIFVELGLAIKQDSPFPHTIVAELANGSIGYIPSRRAYPQGAYEVVSARCAEGSGERLVAAALKLLNESYKRASE